MRNLNEPQKRVDYHIHPSLAGSRVFRRLLAEKHHYPEFTEEQLQGTAYLYLAIPSVEDVSYFSSAYRFPFNAFGIATEKGITRISFDERGPVDVRISNTFSEQMRGKRFRAWCFDNASQLTGDFEALVNQFFAEVTESDDDLKPLQLTFIPREKLAVSSEHTR